ncbi:hypothetical protein H0X32_04270 [Patescibacteria group bacterium]|nr:hypothetical protein [Patescibacteria group bacterium]
MSQLPSTVELKRLSDSELKKQIDEALGSIRQTKPTTSDRHHKKQLYTLLETERISRMLDGEAKAISDMLKDFLHTW